MLLLCLQVCYLLFKVSSVLFIYQHQIKEVAYRELLVDIPHGGCQVISCKETEDGICYRLIFQYKYAIITCNCKRREEKRTYLPGTV